MWTIATLKNLPSLQSIVAPLHDAEAFLKNAVMMLQQLCATGEFLPLAVIAWMLRSAGNLWSNGQECVQTIGRLLGLIVSIVFVGSVFRQQEFIDAVFVLETLLRGLMVCFTAQGVMLLLLCVCSQLAAVFLFPPGRFVRNTLIELLNSVRREVNQIAKSKQAHRSVTDPVADELARQQAAERLRENAVVQAQREAARLQREEAILRSELLYERHSRQLAGSFDRGRFEQFVKRYMSDGTAPDVVEQREQLLKEMIVDSLGKNPTLKFASMTELAAFFAARRQEIASSPPRSSSLKSGGTPMASWYKSKYRYRSRFRSASVRSVRVGNDSSFSIRNSCRFIWLSLTRASSRAVFRSSGSVMGSNSSR